MGEWLDKSPEFVAARYDRLAPFYPAFEWLYGFPVLGVRAKLVEVLQLRLGDAVLEIGCGTGRNLPLIRRAVGPGGAVYGVDLSPGMLTRADRLVRRHGWDNVRLTCGDAGVYTPECRMQAVLFSFSYSTMRGRRAALRRAWDAVDVGGRLVIADAELRRGWPRRVFLATSVWVSDRTLAGKPDLNVADDLAELAAPVEQRRIAMAPGVASFLIASVTKTADG